MIGLSKPKSWYEASLGDIAEIERISITAMNIESGTKYVGLEHLDGNGNILKIQTISNGELASSKFAFGPKHILYGKLRPYLRKIVRPDFDGVCSTDILPIRSTKVDRGFLFHYLRHPRVVEYATARCEGANLPRISPSELAKFRVHFPPSLPEQRRIAEILDKADAIRRKRRESTELINDFLRSAYLESFGNPQCNPRAWAGEPLGVVCSVDRGKFTPRPRNDPRFFGGPYPFIQTGDISSSGGLLSKWKQTLNDEGVAVSRSFRPGTVVIAIVGATIGETAILTREMYWA